MLSQACKQVQMIVIAAWWFIHGRCATGAPISPKLQQAQLQQPQLQQPQLIPAQLQQPQLQQPHLQQPQLQQPQLQLQQPSMPCIRPPQIHPCQARLLSQSLFVFFTIFSNDYDYDYNPGIQNRCPHNDSIGPNVFGRFRSPCQQQPPRLIPAKVHRSPCRDEAVTWRGRYVQVGW